MSQSVEKLYKSIEKLNDDSIFGIPIVICYDRIIKAKSAEAKSRLAYTVFLFAKEESRRSANGNWSSHTNGLNNED